MITAIRDGILLGIGLAFLIGPVFFTLVQTSAHKGFKLGLFLAIGIALSDLFYIFLTYAGISQIANNAQIQFGLGIGGSIIMLGFGVNMIIKKIPRTEYEELHISNKHRIKYILKGFALNAINPGVLLFWITTVSTIAFKSGHQRHELIILFLVAIIMNFVFDLGKAYIANRISNLMTDQVIRWINRIMGSALILFSIQLFKNTIWAT